MNLFNQARRYTKFNLLLFMGFLVSPLVHSQTPSLNSADSLGYDTLVVGYNIAPPFVTSENGELHGPSVWLWEHIVQDKNIAFEYVQMNLDSLLNGIADSVVDIGLSPLTITSNRSARMYFSSPYYIAHSSILEKDASGVGKSLEFLGSFFSMNFLSVLAGLVLIILIFGFLVWVFERKKNKEEFAPGWKGLWSGFWWSAVTMTTVGYGDKSPQTAGGRLVALVWMFTAIIVISGFTASIASSLTVSSIGSENYKIEDFKNEKLGTIANSGTNNWLKNNFFTKKKSYSQMPDLFQALDQDKIVGIAYDFPILQSFVNSDTLGRYRMLPIKYDPQFYAMGMNPGLSDELKRYINLEILQLTETMEWKVLLSEFGL